MENDDVLRWGGVLGGDQIKYWGKQRKKSQVHGSRGMGDK